MAHGRRLETTSRPYAPDDADALRGALARVVASEPFRNAPRLVSFLSYVVEKTIAGEGAALKGYTIATQALGRPRRFRSAGGPDRARRGGAPAPGAADLLRGRGRSRSAAHRGAGRRLRADPRGAGGAELRRRRCSRAEPEPAAPAELPRRCRAGRRWSGRRAVARMAAVALVALGIGWFAGSLVRERTGRGHRPSRRRAREDGRSVLVIPPMRNVGEAPETFRPSLLRGTVAEALARFDGFIVVDRDREERAAEPSPLRAAAAREPRRQRPACQRAADPSPDRRARLDARDSTSPRRRVRAAPSASSAARSRSRSGSPSACSSRTCARASQEGSEGHCLILAHDSRFGVSDERPRPGARLPRGGRRRTPDLSSRLRAPDQFLRPGAPGRPQPAARSARPRAARRAEGGRARAPERARPLRHDDARSSRAARPRRRCAKASSPSSSTPTTPTSRPSSAPATSSSRATREGLAAARPGDRRQSRPAALVRFLQVRRGLHGRRPADRAHHRRDLRRRALLSTAAFARALVAFRDGEPERARQLLHEVQAADAATRRPSPAAPSSARASARRSPSASSATCASSRASSPRRGSARPRNSGPRGALAASIPVRNLGWARLARLSRYSAVGEKRGLTAIRRLTRRGGRGAR